MDIFQSIGPAQMETPVLVKTETDKDELFAGQGADFELLLSGLISNTFAMPAACSTTPDVNRELGVEGSAPAAHHNEAGKVVLQSGEVPISPGFSPKGNGNTFPVPFASGLVGEELISKTPSVLPSHFRGGGNDAVQPLRVGDKGPGDVYDFTDDRIGIKEKISWSSPQTQGPDRVMEFVQPEPAVAVQGKSALAGQATYVIGTSEETETNAIDPPAPKIMFTEQAVPAGNQQSATRPETLPESAGLISGRDSVPMQRILPAGTEVLWNSADKTPLPVFAREVSQTAPEDRESLPALSFSAPADPASAPARDNVIMKTAVHQAGQTGETENREKLPNQEPVVIFSDEEIEANGPAIPDFGATITQDKEHPEFILRAEAPFEKLQVDDLTGGNIRALHGPEAAYSVSNKQEFTPVPSEETVDAEPLKKEISGEGIKFNVAQAPADIRINTDNAVPAQKAPAFHEHVSVGNDRFIVTKSDGRSIEITLQPEGLGKLEIEIVIDNGTVNAKIEASQLSGKELVERNISEVMDALSREGISIGGFSVSLKGGKGDDRNEQYFRKEGKEEVSTGQYSAGQSGAAGPVSGQGRINIII